MPSTSTATRKKSSSATKQSTKTRSPAKSLKAAVNSASWLASINKGQSANAQVAYLGDTAFGAGHNISRYVLGNGLTVLVLVDRSAPVVAYQTWFAVGSRHEKPGKTGLAHLFEHLMFNETKNLPKGTFDRQLEEAGAETNAATWVDWTFYYENVPADRLSLVVGLEADRMANLVLRDRQVSSEKEVVANERRMRVDDDVDGTVNELLYRTVFERHGYSWPTIGWMKDIEGFTTQDCRAFYKTFYAPNNATLCVVGDLDVTELLREIQKAYGGMPAAKLPLEDVQPERPQTSERRVEVTQPTVAEKLVIGYRGPALGDNEHASLTVLNEVMFGGRSSWAYIDLVRDTELATEVRGWASTFRDPGIYEINANSRPGVKAEQVLERIDALIERVRRDGVSQQELDKVKARLELASLQGLETAGGKAEQIGFWELITGDPAGVFRRTEQLRRVTVNDVLRAARTFLDPSSRTVILVRPDAATVAAIAAGTLSVDGDDAGDVDHEGDSRSTL
ncbi:MAG: pitrilysin family protein [Polyangiaceae bacterium]